MISQELKDAILTRREDRLKSLAKIGRQVCPRASSITSCDREMVYSITCWDKKPVPEPWLQARFEEGKEQERKVIRELMDLGFEVVEGQKPFEIKSRQGKVILTGSIDGKALWKDKKVPFEVKSLDPNIYQQINEVDDFNKYDWARKYPLQMQVYLYGHNEEEGLFIITDCKGHWKIFTVTLDLGEMEKILQRCEFVMDSIDRNEMPAFCKDASICRKCWALGKVCAPDMNMGPGLVIIEDAEMEVMLVKREELRSANKEYDEIDTYIKGYFKGKPNSVCGNFQITGKPRIAKYPAQEARTVESWTTKIERIKE